MSDLRCPFCHDALHFEHAKWVACAGCLARHHASCWEESRACASCGDPRALRLAEKSRRSVRWQGVVAVLGVTCVQGALLLGLLSLHDRRYTEVLSRLDGLESKVELDTVPATAETILDTRLRHFLGGQDYHDARQWLAAGSVSREEVVLADRLWRSTSPHLTSATRRATVRELLGVK